MKQYYNTQLEKMAIIDKTENSNYMLDDSNYSNSNYFDFDSDFDEFKHNGTDSLPVEFIVVSHNNNYCEETMLHYSTMEQLAKQNITNTAILGDKYRNDTIDYSVLDALAKDDIAKLAYLMK